MCIVCSVHVCVYVCVSLHILVCAHMGACGSQRLTLFVLLGDPHFAYEMGCLAGPRACIFEVAQLAHLPPGSLPLRTQDSY